MRVWISGSALRSRTSSGNWAFFNFARNKLQLGYTAKRLSACAISRSRNAAQNGRSHNAFTPRGVLSTPAERDTE